MNAKQIFWGKPCLFAGGFIFKPRIEHLKLILHFNQTTEVWQEVDNMVHARLFHGMGFVEYDEDICKGT